jgi:hypothetical protein
MSRTALVVALSLCAVPSTAWTLPVYQDPFGAPGLASGFDLAPGGPIVVVFEAVASHGASSLLLPRSESENARLEGVLLLATSCQLAGCADGVAYEYELTAEAAGAGAAASCDLAAAQPACELASRLR